MEVKVDYTNVDPILKEKVERRQKERQEQFANLKKEHKLTDKAKEIVALAISELRKKLQSHELSAKEVLSAYIAKALEVNDKHNCITQFVPKAVEWAAALDKKASSGEALGPLHGIPFGVKEDQDIEGMDTTLGFAKDLYKPAKDTSAVVKSLMKMGAVPFCKTNFPQSLFSTGSDNPIYGITSNGLNEKMAPGGSSSGSGCIVAAGGAPFATGSDLGGSLRIPAHMNGVSSLRPTIKRLGGKGLVQALPDLFILPGVPGIIAPDVETLSLVWKAMTEDCLQNKYDPLAVPIPWNEKVFSSKDKLKIGYFTSMEFFPAFPDTQKTVLEAKKALETKGHTLVEFEMPDSFEYMQAVWNNYQFDKGSYLQERYEGEPVALALTEHVKTLRKKASGESLELPDTTKWSKMEKVWFGNGAEEEFKTPEDVWNHINKKRDFTQDILGRMEKAGVDLLLTPTYPHPAVKLEHGHEMIQGIAYTSIWNFVDFPAGVVKFGKETGTGLESYDDRNCSILKLTNKALSESKGMPITVQIVGTPFREELVLKAMLELEKEWKAKN